MVRVKICGITSLGDALQACEAGADALGFVFYPPSPRAVTPTAAAEIIRALPPFVTSVGLFVNPEAAVVEQVLDETRLDLLQFHGDETAVFCRGFDRPYIKAIRMREDLDLDKVVLEFSCARGILLDAFDPGRYGGTGQTFAWDRVRQDLGKPVIVAGGLTPDNVGEAIRVARPWGVDVSGGVESGKGIKDPERVTAFVRGAKRG